MILYFLTTNFSILSTEFYKQSLNVFFFFNVCSFSTMKWCIILTIFSVNIYHISYSSGIILIENDNSTKSNRLSRNISNSAQQENNSIQKGTNSAEPPTSTIPVHHLDFLTIIIPFLCLFSVAVVICMLNLFKTSLLSSPSPGPGYRYTPDINVIEPTRSVAVKEVITDNDEANDSHNHGVIYLTTLGNKN